MEVIIEGSWRAVCSLCLNVILSPRQDWKFQCPNGTHLPYDLPRTIGQNEELLEGGLLLRTTVMVPRITYAFLAYRTPDSGVLCALVSCKSPRLTQKNLAHPVLMPCVLKRCLVPCNLYATKDLPLPVKEQLAKSKTVSQFWGQLRIQFWELLALLKRIMT